MMQRKFNIGLTRSLDPPPCEGGVRGGLLRGFGLRPPLSPPFKGGGHEAASKEQVCKSCIFLLLAALIFSGAGCARQPLAKVSPNLPTLEIVSPPQGTVTTTTSIEINGKSNNPEILVNGNRHLVIDGIFSVLIELATGTNNIVLQAGNGYTTTTQALQIQRVEEAQ